MIRNSNRPNWICLVLLLLIIVKAGIMPMICLDYELRRDYIVKNICVNRNKPQMHCDGKCYLAKKLAESQKQEEKAAESGYLASLIYLVMQPEAVSLSFDAPLHVDGREHVSFEYHSPFLPSEVATRVFRPPLS